MQDANKTQNLWPGPLFIKVNGKAPIEFPGAALDP